MIDKKVPANIHNDFALDLLETEEDCRAAIALSEVLERLGKITVLPTSYSDSEQRERRPDKVVKAKVLDGDGKEIGERIYLFECKSEINIVALWLQLLIYVAILWMKHRLPVTPIIIYTGKRPLQHNGRVNFREHMRRKHPVIHDHDINFTAFLLNPLKIGVSVLIDKARLIAPGLYLAPRIHNLTA